MIKLVYFHKFSDIFEGKLSKFKFPQGTNIAKKMNKNYVFSL